jgi:hypothetical protein
MAYTVQAAFDEFYNTINLGGDHRGTANKRRDHIIELLGKRFTILDAFGTGSIPRFTALKGEADVDVIVVLHYGKHIKGKTPKEVLQSVRDALGQSKNQVRKNGQAVTLYYTTWPNVDIVPVSRTTDDNDQVLYYNVPNMNDGTWIKSKPRAHSTDIEDRASVCGANFRKLIKMMKWWNLRHSDYLQSYHIEVMALNTFTTALSDLPWEMFQFFDKCHQLTESSLWHDIGYADDYLSYSNRQEVRKRLLTATDQARMAWYHGHGGLQKEAINAWGQVFGNGFPAYG